MELQDLRPRLSELAQRLASAEEHLKQAHNMLGDLQVSLLHEETEGKPHKPQELPHA